MKNLITPRVHRNGTSKAELMRQIGAVRNSLAIAQAAMQKATPNGRDYYTISDDACQQARDAWFQRYDALNAIDSEMLDIQIEINKQGE